MDPRNAATAIDADEDLAQRADHEAGHYMIAYMGGLLHEVAYLTVERALRPGTKIPTGGCCALDFCPPGPTPEQWGIYSAGGMVAQLAGICLRRGWSFDDPRVEPWRKKVEADAQGDVDQMKERLGPDVDVDHYGDLAGVILAKHVELWEELSRELRRHRVLYRDEAWMIVGGMHRGYLDFKAYLEVYREHRHTFDTSGPKGERFRRDHPGCPKWVESFYEFREREGCREGEDFRAWYASKMGREYEGDLDEDFDDGDED